MSSTPAAKPSADHDHDALPTVRGTLLEHKGDLVVLGIPGSDYRLHLVVEIDLPPTTGWKVNGTIHATARRVDKVGTGGCYVEPIYGRPRRVQGRVVGGHGPSRTLYVKAGPTLICTLGDERQQPGDFTVGDLVSFDVEAGSVLKPILP